MVTCKGELDVNITFIFPIWRSAIKVQEYETRVLNEPTM